MGDQSSSEEIHFLSALIRDGLSTSRNNCARGNKYPAKRVNIPESAKPEKTKLLLTMISARDLILKTTIKAAFKLTP